MAPGNVPGPLRDATAGRLDTRQAIVDGWDEHGEHDDSVLQVALSIGYESEAAFNRAFERELDLPPARYRRTRTRP